MGHYPLLPIRPAPSRHFLTSYFVDKVHYNVVFLYAEAVEVLSNSLC